MRVSHTGVERMSAEEVRILAERYLREVLPSPAPPRWRGLVAIGVMLMAALVVIALLALAS